MKPIRVATICLNSQDRRQDNLAKAAALVRDAAAAGADWVALPEMLAYLGPYSGLKENSDLGRGEIHGQLSALAKEAGVVLFAGTIGVRASEVADKVQNTHYVFGRDGTEIAAYAKTHLFNLEAIGDAAAYRESDGFEAGDKLVTVEIDGYQVGLSICYDLRFPEFYAKLASERSLDVILVPSAFTKATGEAHWHTLLKARAIEQQSYVIAPNQTGSHGAGKFCYGHSVVIDPWGEVLADTGADVGIAFADIDPSHLQAIRNRLPARKNRRPELY